MINGLDTLASRTDAARGAVIPVEDNAAVAAPSHGPRNSCSPGKANDVAGDRHPARHDHGRPSVKYIVARRRRPGVPYGRLLDNTSYANERGYATTFLGATNNQYLSIRPRVPAYRRPVRRDDYSGHGPYTPEISVGRLVETPTQIVSLINQYVSVTARSPDPLRRPATTSSRTARPGPSASTARCLPRRS